MKTQKGTFSSVKTGVKSKSRGESGSGSGPQSITKSHVTLRDRAAANMAAFKKSQKH
jgi:hypothetical protein